MSGQQDRQLRRVARQHMESLQRAGVSHLPRIANHVIATPASDSPGRKIEEEQPDGTQTTALGTAEKSHPQPMDSHALLKQAAPIPCKSLFDIAEANTQKEDALTKSTHAPLSRAEREDRLKELAKQVAACQRCQELASTRTQTVFGVGNPEARILFIGEAPGADEDRQGEPFVGRAGRLLNDIIAACRWKREELYICNILRCRPPQNRTPSPEEAANCREYLDGQIATVDPEYIVCWGSVAAQNLLDTKLSTGKLRGKFLSYGRAKVLCTYHPAYLLRNPDAKKDVWNDMKFLMRDMGIDLTTG